MKRWPPVTPSLVVGTASKDARLRPGAISGAALQGGQPKQGGEQVLRIRLARFGAKKRPIYRVVVIERERARDGKVVEVVGQYNPLTDPATVGLKADRVRYWMERGAQPSERVRHLLEKQPGPEEQSPELGL